MRPLGQVLRFRSRQDSLHRHCRALPHVHQVGLCAIIIMDCFLKTVPTGPQCLVSAQRLPGWAGSLLHGLQSTSLLRSSLLFTPPSILLNAPSFQGMVHPAWSLYVFGSLSAVAGLLAAFSLTESLGYPLPNTFEVFCQTHIFVISLSRIWRG